MSNKLHDLGKSLLTYFTFFNRQFQEESERNALQMKSERTVSPSPVWDRFIVSWVRVWNIDCLFSGLSQNYRTTGKRTQASQGCCKFTVMLAFSPPVIVFKSLRWHDKKKIQTPNRKKQTKAKISKKNHLGQYNKRYHKKVLRDSFELNFITWRLHPKTWKLELRVSCTTKQHFRKVLLTAFVWTVSHYDIHRINS